MNFGKPNKTKIPNNHCALSYIHDGVVGAGVGLPDILK
jgi:hypothetical protein